MNRSLMRKVSTQLMALVALAVLSTAVALAQDAGAPAQPQGGPAAQQGPRTDGQIEMDVVHALDASAALKNDLITAATIQSEVTLSGTVSSDASKQLAESIAAHVDGVTKVHNNLQIGNPGADAQNPQPAPSADEMPDPDQSQAQKQMANLPPPGPAPDANPRRRRSRWRTCRRRALLPTRIRRIKDHLRVRRTTRSSRSIRSKAAIRSNRTTRSKVAIRHHLRRGLSTRIRRIRNIRRIRSTSLRLRRLHTSLPEDQ